MNHLAESGLKGARAEARASWFYFIPPQRIDGAALGTLYLLIAMDPQKNYSLTSFCSGVLGYKVTNKNLGNKGRLYTILYRISLLSNIRQTLFNFENL